MCDTEGPLVICYFGINVIIQTNYTRTSCDPFFFFFHLQLTNDATDVEIRTSYELRLPPLRSPSSILEANSDKSETLKDIDIRIDKISIESRKW